MTGLPVTEHSYHPQIFDTRSAAGRDAVDTLCTTPGVMVIDGIAAQRESLGRLIPAPDAELLDEPSRWVHYPWRRTVVHLLGPKAFRRLRLDRNRNMITAVEQTRLDRLRVGVREQYPAPRAPGRRRQRAGLQLVAQRRGRDLAL